MKNKDEFIDLENEIKKIKKEIENTSLQKIYELLLTLHNNLKNTLGTGILIYDGNNKNIPLYIKLYIDTQLDNIKIKIKDEYIYCSYEINTISKKMVEEQILLASWHGTAGQLNNEIQEYIIQNKNIKDQKIIKELRNYYFYPSNADILFKNSVLKNLKQFKY